MLYENISSSSTIAGLGLASVAFFLVGLIIQAVRKKVLRIWVWGLIISIIVTIAAYFFAFSGIFQVYDLAA